MLFAVKIIYPYKKDMEENICTKEIETLMPWQKTKTIMRTQGPWHNREHVTNTRSKLCHFFDYNIKLGRVIQILREGPLCNGWRIVSIPDEVLGTFWKGLLCLHVPEKIKLFWWKIGHNVVLVGEWLGKWGSMIVCRHCFACIEILRHYLWDCPQAQRVWIMVIAS